MKLITIWSPLFLSQRIRFQRKGSPHSSVISCNYKKKICLSHRWNLTQRNYNEFWVTYIKYYHNYKVCVSFRLFDQCNIYLASFTYFLSFFPLFCFGFFFSFSFSWGGGRGGGGCRIYHDCYRLAVLPLIRLVGWGRWSWDYHDWAWKQLVRLKTEEFLHC